jgi:hypothetical protein
MGRGQEARIAELFFPTAWVSRYRYIVQWFWNKKLKYVAGTSYLFGGAKKLLE